MFQTTLKKNLRTQLSIIFVSCCFLCLMGSFTPILAYAAPVHTTKTHIASAYCTEQKVAEQPVYDYDFENEFLGYVRLYVGVGTPAYCDYAYGVFLAEVGQVTWRTPITITVYTELSNTYGYTQSQPFYWPSVNTYFRAPHMTGNNSYYAEVDLSFDDAIGPDIWASSGNFDYSLG